MWNRREDTINVNLLCGNNKVGKKETTWNGRLEEDKFDQV